MSWAGWTEFPAEQFERTETADQFFDKRNEEEVAEPHHGHQMYPSICIWCGYYVAEGVMGVTCCMRRAQLNDERRKTKWSQ